MSNQKSNLGDAALPPYYIKLQFNADRHPFVSFRLRVNRKYSQIVLRCDSSFTSIHNTFINQEEKKIVMEPARRRR